MHRKLRFSGIKEQPEYLAPPLHHLADSAGIPAALWADRRSPNTPALSAAAPGSLPRVRSDLAAAAPACGPDEGHSSRVYSRTRTLRDETRQRKTEVNFKKKKKKETRTATCQVSIPGLNETFE